MTKITRAGYNSIIGCSDDGRIIYQPDRSPVDETQIDGRSVYHGRYVDNGADVASEDMIAASAIRREIDAIVEANYQAAREAEYARIDAREAWLDGLATVKGGALDPNLEG